MLNFCSDMNTCVECGTGLIVEKVKSRVVYTVAYGQIGARETIKDTFYTLIPRAKDMRRICQPVWMASAVLFCIAKRIQSENSTSLQTSFEKVKKLFGAPLCSVHDMGRRIISALDLVFVAVIRYQTQALGKVAGGKQLAEKLFYQVAGQDKLTSKEFLLGTLYGYLLNLKSHENKCEGYGFPFDRPKVRYYKQNSLLRPIAQHYADRYFIVSSNICSGVYTGDPV